ncbi:coagulation factor XII isoform X3 [Heteronotia binoei]|uniref:coagulation factor XII isoform X3 n=1 Tax=Heteronotia binoei TaxID=13085 RepID=UPI00292D5715|nr:coagulation factor XII isoform X3 [Heteronotia binoei]
MVSSEELCHFPFRYQREMHYSCLPGSFADPEAWCATTENYDRDRQRRYCEKQERPRGHCDPNPCQNGAVCEARRTGFHCICNPGFYGKHCEKESCFESPGRLHIGEKETWLSYQPAGLEECHCAGKKKIVCKPVYGKACTTNPCLNGGHCIMLKQGWVCGCPGRFSGPLCDIDHSHTCYSGNGHLYRGIAQSTSLGEPCLPWDSPILFHEFSSNTLENAASLGLGSHAFCRPAVSQISVVLGQTIYNVTTKGSIKFQVQGYQLHENYSAINKHNDIALVRLKENGPGHCAEFSHSISPVCLPSSMEKYDEGSRCQIAGWGHLYEGADKLSQYLQEADVPVIPHEQCQAHNVHGTRVTLKMLCAGYMDGRSDACQGDSGGPLVCEEQNKAILRGIVSWGTGCAQENKPGVYTNVAHYLDWIQTKMH